MKAIFADEGLTGLNFPKTVLREAFSAGLIEKDELWLAMLSDRNTTANIYSEQLAIKICSKFIKEYACEFTALAMLRLLLLSQTIMD